MTPHPASVLNAPQPLSRNDTAIFKGVAILLMLYIHCFQTVWYVNPEISAAVKAIGVIPGGGICVSVFAFLTGWAYALARQKTWRYSLRKITCLFIEYWVVVVLFVVFAVFFCSYRPTGADLFDELFPSYDGGKNRVMIFAWYVSLYPLLMILLPFAEVFERGGALRKPGVVGLYGGTYVICLGLNHLFRTNICIQYFPVALVGYCCARAGILERLSSGNGYLAWGISPVCAAAVWWLRERVSVPFVNMDMLSVPLLLLAILYARPLLALTKLNVVLAFLGKHSMNIWFAHCLFFSSVTRYVVQSVFFDYPPPPSESVLHNAGYTPGFCRLFGRHQPRPALLRAALA